MRFIKLFYQPFKTKTIFHMALRMFYRREWLTNTPIILLFHIDMLMEISNGTRLRTLENCTFDISLSFIRKISSSSQTRMEIWISTVDHYWKLDIYSFIIYSHRNKFHSLDIEIEMRKRQHLWPRNDPSLSLFWSDISTSTDNTKRTFYFQSTVTLRYSLTQRLLLSKNDDRKDNLQGESFYLHGFN